MIVHSHVYEPKTASDGRAEHHTIDCSAISCPFRDKGECIARGFTRCEYGKRSVEKGPTVRARGFWKWIKARKGGPSLKFATSVLAFIDDHVFIPYRMDGPVWIKRSEWDLELVLKIIDHEPRDWFGNKVTTYAKDVEKFVRNIKDFDPDMWSQLVTVRPEWDCQFDPVGRLAKLVTLSPCKVSEHWQWDGSVLRGRSPIDEVIWGGPSEVTVKPSPDRTVKVLSSEWVNSNTVFVD